MNRPLLLFFFFMQIFVKPRKLNVSGFSREFDLSERQAYRYLEEASQLDRAIEVPEATVPITLKLLAPTVELLRKYARSSGLTIGAIVTGALKCVSTHSTKAWLRRVKKAVHFKSTFPIRLIARSSRGWRRPTIFWCPIASALSACA